MYNPHQNINVIENDDKIVLADVIGLIQICVWYYGIFFDVIDVA